MTESEKKAIEKYNQKVQQISARIDKNIYNSMIEYCQKNDYTKKDFLEKAIQAYIDNN